MAINTATLTTDLDVVSDLIEAEQDTDAHYATCVAAIKASATTVTQVLRLQALLANLANDMGIGACFQKDSLAS